MKTNTKNFYQVNRPFAHKSRTENGNGGATPPPGYRAIHAQTTAYRTRRTGKKRAHTVTGTSHARTATAPDGAAREPPQTAKTGGNDPERGKR